jgi:glycosyltransferase involved in cell wall biosynthesis
MKNIEPARICFIAGTLGKGGAEKQAYYLLKVLKENGHDITLIYYSNEHWWRDKISDLGISVIHVSQNSKSKRIIQAYKILKGQNFQFVQAVHYHMNPYAVVLARLIGAKSVGAFRSDGRRELLTVNKYVRMLTFKFGNGFIVNSRRTLHALSEISLLNNKIYYLPNIVDIPSELVVTENETALRFLAVNSLIKLKRLDLVLIFFSKYLKNQPNASLTILGDGVLKKELIQFSIDLGIGDKVTFKGVVNDVSAYYESADVLLLASESEGTPNVVLEGMSYGKVVVTSNVGDTQFLINHGKSGILLDFENDEQVKSTIELLYNQWPSVRVYGEKANDRILENHAYSHLYGNIRAIYKQL